MDKHRAVIIGAGRIGAGYQWGDLEYTHAGAYRALKDRVDLVGFVETSEVRAQSAKLRWHVPVYEQLEDLGQIRPEIVSVCVPPNIQPHVMARLQRFDFIKAYWVEKPFTSHRIINTPMQVNYLRRGDSSHQYIASVAGCVSRLIVYAKDDIHTRCHFDDLARWWKCQLDYRVFNGPCAYIASGAGQRFFDQGGVNPGECMKAMLGNLLDHIDHGTPLWSPPYSEEKEVHIEL